jgi:hypothetical protein
VRCGAPPMVVIIVLNEIVVIEIFVVAIFVNAIVVDIMTTVA